MNESPNRSVPGGTVGKVMHLLARVPYAYLAIAQGAYYFLGGLWPMISLASFFYVTGPKTDIWLVKTVGLLLMVIGAVQMVAGIRWRVTLEILLLSVGSAVVLAAVEITCVLRKTISPVYLLDAVVELVLIALWLSLYIRGFSSPEVCSLYEPTFGRSRAGESD